MILLDTALQEVSVEPQRRERGRACARPWQNYRDGAPSSSMNQGHAFWGLAAGAAFLMTVIFMVCPLGG